MAEGAYDIAICGATPFAGLLAGLLASVHGKRVCLVGEPWSPYRLPRNFDVSVMPAARPETWLLLKRGGAETLKLLAAIGKGLFERVDPLFVADLPASADYLGHMRWAALGMGFAAERAVERAVTAEGSICRIRDAAMLVGGRAEPAIEAWLAKLGVGRLPADTEIAARREGGYTLRAGDEEGEALSVVLADDEAIVSRLGATERHRLIVAAPRTSLTTEPAPRPMPASFVHWLDRDVVLHQRTGKSPVAAIAGGEADIALPRIGASLMGAGRLRRTAQARFRAFATLDGAPLVGRMGKAKFTAIAGLGASAAFLTPIVARVLAEAAADDERRYFEARGTGKASARADVAETVAAGESEPVP